MAIALVPEPVEPETPTPDVPVGRLRKLTISAETFGSAGTQARRKWREFAGDEIVAYPDDVDRPLTRGECRDMPRPRPFVSCSHHLYLDVNPSGSLTVNFPHIGVHEMKESCSLDVADRAGITLEEVGAIVGVTRERIRQVEEIAVRKIARESGAELGIPVASPSPARTFAGRGRGAD